MLRSYNLVKSIFFHICLRKSLLSQFVYLQEDNDFQIKHIALIFQNWNKYDLTITVYDNYES